MVIRTRPNSSIGIAACMLDLHVDSNILRVLPAGLFKARDGRPVGLPGWRLDAAIAERLIAIIAARSDDLVIDYEHQTLYATDNGQPAPAAGWFKTLEWRDDGLYATDLRWTERARLMIAGGEYKYFSPVLTYDRQTGAVLDLLMGAITNYPAIDGLDQLTARAAARFSLTREDLPMTEAMLKLLGLTQEASTDEIAAAVAALTAQIATTDAALATAQQTATEAQAALTAATAHAGNQGDPSDGTPDPAKFVPVATVTALQAEIASLSARINAAEVGDLVDAAMGEGKILPAMETWARELGQSNLAALKTYIAGAQPIAALSGSQTGGQAPEGQGENGLSAAEMAVCRATGIDIEAYKKTRTA